MPETIEMTRESNDLFGRRTWRSREEIEIERQLESLLLSRERLVREVQGSTSLVLRIARERALEHVDLELASISARSAPPRSL